MPKFMKFIPFYFKRIENGVLLSNILRDFIILTEDEFDLFSSKKVNIDTELYKKLYAKNFIYDEARIDEYAATYLDTKASYFDSTFLHIFVVTLSCNLSCLYCQAATSQQSTNMSEEVARKAIDLALQSPSENLQIEFQGGEPLLNFPIIRYIVEQFEKRNTTKKISFSVVTNTQCLTDEILEYLIQHKVSLCFSIDGAKEVHDYNRPSKNGKSNYESVVHWISVCKQKGVRVGLLPTVTSKTIANPMAFMEQLYLMGARRFSIRELAPLGRCLQNWDLIGYSSEEFFDFYKKIISIINERWKNGQKIIESYTMMYMEQIYTKRPNRFTDFKSPCGAGIGQMAYNWDGTVYACDEGRMIANNGDYTFKIGTVSDTYKKCITSDSLRSISCASCVEAHPVCHNCVFNPICGICPAYNYAITKNLIGMGHRSSRCKNVQKICEYIIQQVENKTEIGKMFIEWLTVQDDFS